MTILELVPGNLTPRLQTLLTPTQHKPCHYSSARTWSFLHDDTFEPMTWSACWVQDGDCGCVSLQALSALRSTSLERCYRHVEELADKLEGLKQRFGLKSAQRLVHSAQLAMEKVTRGRRRVERRSHAVGDGLVCLLQLLDNAVYTLELFLQPSAKLQPLGAPVKMARAKERVLKVKTRPPGSHPLSKVPLNTHPAGGYSMVCWSHDGTGPDRDPVKTRELRDGDQTKTKAV